MIVRVSGNIPPVPVTRRCSVGQQIVGVVDAVFLHTVVCSGEWRQVKDGGATVVPVSCDRIAPSTSAPGD